MGVVMISTNCTTVTPSTTICDSVTLPQSLIATTPRPSLWKQPIGALLYTAILLGAVIGLIILFEILDKAVGIEHVLEWLDKWCKKFMGLFKRNKGEDKERAGKVEGVKANEEILTTQNWSTH
ncbi:hypothetical protein HYFRA_00013313 [Hymenoscyphus fraxineus]|uniref:Uncharacterized protein n=1 Tax=Hymenoscyphus fraxineus TaxID=746836 RepID=A0A9N9LD26_9HELO|nr:hypothetical protein HYFRA_00013313 [Hymenoscyphus fraxineus]